MGENPEIVGGKVSRIATYGAFVKLEDGSSGLVHISEIADGYVQNVTDYLSVGMDVNVVVLSTDETGKKKLSIKKAGPISKLSESFQESQARDKEDKKLRKKQQIKERNEEAAKRLFSAPPEDDDDFGGGSKSFEDRMSRFMKDSEERQTDVKHQTDKKRGGGYVRRG